MQAQYLAHQSLPLRRSEALESQASVMPGCGYLLTRVSDIVSSRWAVAHPYLRWVSTRSKNLEGSIKKDRRRGCPRALSFLHWQACWPALQPAVALKKKSLSWLSPNPFRSSPHSPASTSKPVTGWTFRSAPLAHCGALKLRGQAC